MFKLPQLNQMLPPEQIKNVAAAVSDGPVPLPKLEQDPSSPNIGMWSLGDSGRATHAADHERPFPGAALRESDGKNGGQARTAANGEDLQHHCGFDVDVSIGNTDGIWTENTTTFRNLKVVMRTCSPDNVARETHRVTLRDDHGTTLHKADKHNLSRRGRKLVLTLFRFMLFASPFTLTTRDMLIVFCQGWSSAMKRADYQ